MGGCDGYDSGTGVDAKYRPRARESCKGFGEDAATAPDVEVGEGCVFSRWGPLPETSVDKLMSDGVHKVEETRGPARVPPCRRQIVEVGDLGWVYGGGVRADELPGRSA